MMGQELRNNASSFKLDPPVVTALVLVLGAALRSRTLG